MIPGTEDQRGSSNGQDSPLFHAAVTGPNVINSGIVSPNLQLVAGL